MEMEYILPLDVQLSGLVSDGGGLTGDNTLDQAIGVVDKINGDTEKHDATLALLERAVKLPDDYIQKAVDYFEKKTSGSYSSAMHDRMIVLRYANMHDYADHLEYGSILH